MLVDLNADLIIIVLRIEARTDPRQFSHLQCMVDYGILHPGEAAMIGAALIERRYLGGSTSC